MMQKTDHLNSRLTGKLKGGQAMVLVLLITVILISVTTLAVGMIVTNALSTTREVQGSHALEIAESGAEEGILRILRDPSVVTSTPITLTVDSGSATVSIAGAGTKTITSTGTVGGYSRVVETQVHLTAGQLVIDSWREL